MMREFHQLSSSGFGLGGGASVVMSPGRRPLGLREAPLPPFFLIGRLCFFPLGFLEVFLGDIITPFLIG